MLQFVWIIVYEFCQTQIERLEQARDNGEAIDFDQVCCVDKYYLHLMHSIKFIWSVKAGFHITAGACGAAWVVVVSKYLR